MKSPAVPTVTPQHAPSGKPARADYRIRRSASELFYRDGIRAVGVDEIVKRAGATKPTLYRSFGSKDELAASCMRDYADAVSQRFEAVIAGHAPGRAQLQAYFDDIAHRTSTGGFRGCGLTNAAVEYPRAPQPHPARVVAEENKRAVRARLQQMARDAGASDPEALGDALMLLLEGCFVSAQLFGPDTPGKRAGQAAARLMDAYGATQ